ARPARLSADVAATGVLDAARVRGSFRTGARLLAGSVDVAVRGLRAAPVRGYLAALDLVPAAERVDADAVLEIDLQPRSDDPDGAAGRIVARAAVHADGAEAVALDELRCDIAHLDARRLDVAHVLVGGVRLAAERREDGGLRALGLDLPAGGGSGGGEPEAAAPAPSASPAPGAPFAFTLGALELRDLECAFTDAAVSPATRLVVRLPQGKVEHLPPRAGET